MFESMTLYFCHFNLDFYDLTETFEDNKPNQIFLNFKFTMYFIDIKNKPF